MHVCKLVVQISKESSTDIHATPRGRLCTSLRMKPISPSRARALHTHTHAHTHPSIGEPSASHSFDFLVSKGSRIEKSSLKPPPPFLVSAVLTSGGLVLRLPGVRRYPLASLRKLPGPVRPSVGFASCCPLYAVSFETLTL